MPIKNKTNRGYNNDQDFAILIRYFAIAAFFLFAAILIICSIVKIAFKEHDEWMKLAKSETRSEVLLNPSRGNIYSFDDRLMATSMPSYYLYIDFRVSGYREYAKKYNNKNVNRDTFLYSKNNGIDSLAFYLSRKLKDRTPEGYKSYLMKGFKTKSKQYPLCAKRVSYTDLKEIRQFPFFRFGRNRSGLFAKEMMQRKKPFGTLASRTIGNIYGEIDTSGVTKGESGLELRYDSLLRGKAGITSKQRVAGVWADIVRVEPVNGIDIRTTIDIEIQDLTEKALVDKLKEIDAESGTAVVMEVKTGEIKAMTNMARNSVDHYVEDMNHAVRDMIEPGSTFKVAAMMVAIEDGLAQPSDPVDVGNGIYMYNGRRMTDHNSHRGGYGMITAEKSIWYSSNIGVAKVIRKAYENNPKKFIDGLHRIGMDADLKLDLQGVGKSRLRWPSDKGWSKVSLGWISFGYEVQILPIQTLAFFNAIANNGKMMRPMLVKDILKDGKSIDHKKPEILIDGICSDRTLKIMQGMLYNVVNYDDPTPANRDGTGKPAKSDVITIAGKTGTAQIQGKGGRSGHNVSFCGYFPYENPQYTCIVVIRRPSGSPSGGLMCGTVVKEIAEKIYSNCTLVDVKHCLVDSARVTYPSIKNGDYASLKTVMNGLNLKANGTVKSKYVSVNSVEGKENLKDIPIVDNLVPNVVGMGAKDAVFAMENCGLRVLLSGTGRVISQSIQNGAKINKGQTITLTLK